MPHFFLKGEWKWLLGINCNKQKHRMPAAIPDKSSALPTQLLRKSRRRPPLTLMSSCLWGLNSWGALWSCWALELSPTSATWGQSPPPCRPGSAFLSREELAGLVLDVMTVRPRLLVQGSSCRITRWHTGGPPWAGNGLFRVTRFSRCTECELYRNLKKINHVWFEIYNSYTMIYI